ncbi:hypothetical protein JCM18920_488 [Cutibacterium acnes JCM 18920]|nr:hypothetical protein JCM18920_488 [Cutibacterium acnes JCM 18920]
MLIPHPLASQIQVETHRRSPRAIAAVTAAGCTPIDKAQRKASNASGSRPSKLRRKH